MRVTSDKSLRLVLSTFKNLREELCHLQDDLGVSPVPHCPQLIQLFPAGSRSPGLAFQAVAVLMAVAALSVPRGAWMATGGLGSSRGSLGFSHPSSVAVDAGSRSFLLGKQQCFPHQPKCWHCWECHSIVLENAKLREKEFELEPRTRSLCSRLSFAVVFVCLGFFCWLLFKLFLGQTGRAVSRIPGLTTQHKATGTTVCAVYLNPRLSRKLSILSILKHPFTKNCVCCTLWEEFTEKLQLLTVSF